jgi:hypothetical protein
MGRQAGRNMAGAGERYTHLLFFCSDLFELGYEAVGELDPRLKRSVSGKSPTARASCTTWAQGGSGACCRGMSGRRLI